jgi:tRNA A37 threonylcarbamoyladenosine dehydratase
MEAFDRVKLLIGEENYNKLKSSHVAIFGVGGVGGFTAEALVRSGVGEITLFDNEVFSFSNLNRQIFSTTEDVGRLKTEVAKKRLLSINPNLIIHVNNVFYLPENAENYPFSEFDLVIDAIDTVTAKLEIIERAKKENVEVISCLGTGGKLSPNMLKVSDIEKTSVCPLARVMRRELKKRGIKNVKVVYSEEEPKGDSSKAKQPPSMIFVPGTAGLLLAKEGVEYLINR